MKKISVIIPCYCAVKWLPQCFLSLVNQTIGIENLELIFVDDASADEGKTWEMLLMFERAYPDSVIVIRQEENRRQGGARNEGLLYASGEYVAFVDADDWVKPELYEKTYRRAKELDADILQYDHCLYRDKVGEFDHKNKMEEAFFEIKSEDDRKKFLISEKITYGSWNKLYKRQLVERANVRFAEHVDYEEPLFVYPLLYYGKRFAVMPDKLYVYRQNDTGIMWKDLQRADTLIDHVRVQYKVWQFMKHTEYFKTYYEEIKLYFLHTCFYETLYFAKLRDIEVPMEQYRVLERMVLKEVPDLDESVYETLIPRQIKLYRLAKKGMKESDFGDYMEQIGDFV